MSFLKVDSYDGQSTMSMINVGNIVAIHLMKDAIYRITMVNGEHYCTSDKEAVEAIISND